MRHRLRRASHGTRSNILTRWGPPMSAPTLRRRASTLTPSAQARQTWPVVLHMGFASTQVSASASAGGHRHPI
jgi:hypothetical protein